MRANGLVRNIRFNVILFASAFWLVTLLPANQSLALTTSDSNKSQAQSPGVDDLTAAALHRAAQHKLGTAAPPSATNANDTGPIIVSRPVVSEAAPGTEANSEPGSLPQPSTEATTKAAAAMADDDVVVVMKPKQNATPEPSKELTHQEAASGTTSKPKMLSTVSAETSLKWLENGNTRFIKKRFRTDGRSAADRKRLLAGQKPHAIILSCSDSRVPPEIVFDQSLGEVFVIRVAGEVVDDSVIASIEYAVQNFGSKLLVVMGHTQCGAVHAALDAKEKSATESEAPSASMMALLSSIQTHLKTLTTEKPSPDLQIESALNADGVARDLVKRSELLRRQVEAGALVIKPALYRLDSGKVSFY